MVIVTQILEISVFDEIKTADGFSQAIKIIKKAILKWIRSGDVRPLTIVVKKVEDRGPPVLSIDVNDVIKSSGGLV